MEQKKGKERKQESKTYTYIHSVTYTELKEDTWVATHSRAAARERDKGD